MFVMPLLAIPESAKGIVAAASPPCSILSATVLGSSDSVGSSLPVTLS